MKIRFVYDKEVHNFLLHLIIKFLNQRTLIYKIKKAYDTGLDFLLKRLEFS